VDKPTSHPRWADNPGAPPPTAITEPTEPIKNKGWANVSGWNLGRYVRQVGNWLHNLHYRWGTWLDQTTHRTSDFHPDHILPGGADPAPTAVGLSMGAGEFSARIYVDGYEVPLTSNLAFTLVDNRDTYAFLARDATWYYADVPNGDPQPSAPGGTPPSLAVFAIRASGGNRTALLFNAKRTMVEANRLRWGWELLGTAANRTKPRLSFPFRNGGSEYIHVADFVDTAADGAPAGQCVHVYVDEGRRDVVTVKGAYWTSAGLWQTEGSSFPATVRRQSLLAFNQARLLVVNAAGTFSDSDFFGAMVSAGALTKGSIIDGRFHAGLDLTNSDFEVGEVARFRADVVTTGGSVPTHTRDDGAAGCDYALPIAAQGTGAVGKGREWSANCRRTKPGGAAQWDRLAPGDAYKFELTADGGFRIYRHDAGDGAPWNDTVTPTTWILVFEASGVGGASTPGQLSGGSLVISGASLQAGPVLWGSPLGAPLPSAGYRELVPKVWGSYETNGSGGFTAAYCFGGTLSFSGTAVRVTMANAKLQYAPQATMGVDGFARCVKIDSTHFDIDVFTVGSGFVAVNQTTTPGSIVHFSVLGADV
jgi:hypothetical protein